MVHVCLRSHCKHEGPAVWPHRRIINLEIGILKIFMMRGKQKRASVDGTPPIRVSKLPNLDDKLVIERKSFPLLNCFHRYQNICSNWRHLNSLPSKHTINTDLVYRTGQTWYSQFTMRGEINAQYIAIAPLPCIQPYDVLQLKLES